VVHDACRERGEHARERCSADQFMTCQSLVSVPAAAHQSAAEQLGAAMLASIIQVACRAASRCATVPASGVGVTAQLP
jgi:hypothetical protein